jgi:signal transduction histidine kinase
MSRDLSPSILEDLGLSAALRRLAEDFRQLHGIDFAVDMDRIDHLFSETARIILYRILQEALTNIEKHARAQKASLTIRRKPDRVFFEIKDDGTGFEVARALAAEKGLGLATISERVRMLHGSLKLGSRPGSGTCISFEIPLQEVTG